MYGFESSGGAMSALWVLISLLVVIALTAGALLGGAELFSPSVHRAEADKLQAEAAALRAQTAHEEQLRKLELAAAEDAAAVELQALKDRRTKQLALVEPVAIVGMIVGSIAVLAVAATGSYYFVAKARVIEEEESPSREQAALPRTPSLLFQHQQERLPNQDRDLSSGERARTKHNDISYDGFLSYFCDRILYSGRRRVAYMMATVPEAEDIYLTIMTEAQIISWETNDRAGWILSRHIWTVEDVRRRVSRRVFYSLASVCRSSSVTAPLLSGNGEPQ